MVAAATGAAMSHPVRAEVRRTDPDNHYQTTRLGLAPVDQLHLVCAYRPRGGAECGQSVACLTYDVTAGGYLWSLKDLCAPIAAHVRQCHDERVTSLPPRT